MENKQKLLEFVVLGEKGAAELMDDLEKHGVKEIKGFKIKGSVDPVELKVSIW